MEYPVAVLEKAKRLEQLLQGVAAGESLDKMNEMLGFGLDAEELACAQAKYEAGGCTWEALIDGRYGHAQKAHSALREWLYARKEDDEEVRAPQLTVEIKEKFGVELHPGHINYLLRKRGLSAPPGRPYKREPPSEERPATETTASEPIDHAGAFFPGGSEGRDGGGEGGREDSSGGPRCLSRT
jgi:transposase